MSNPAPGTGEVRADLDPEAKAEMRRWVERWRIVGAMLDEERWARLRASSDDDLRARTLDLLGLWQPGLPGDEGEALLIQQRVFARSRGSVER